MESARIAVCWRLHPGPNMSVVLRLNLDIVNSIRARFCVYRKEMDEHICECTFNRATGKSRPLLLLDCGNEV